MFCLNPVGFGHIFQIEMKPYVAAGVRHRVSDEASIACLTANQLKVRELHFNFVRFHSATQAKHYSSLQPGGGAGPPPPSGHVDVFQTALGYKCSCYLSRGRSFISFLCVYL